VTWQIAEIAVFGQNEKAVIPFKKGRLNVITGRSQTGKSTILEIVDYCLLSKTCRIPKGLVRNSIDGVGLLIEGPLGTLGITRNLRKPGALQTANCWISRNIQALPDALPAPNRSITAGKDEISGFTGIENLPLLSGKAGQPKASRPPANIRHCAPYLFQHQDVIDNRNVAFAGLDNQRKIRHLTDSIGYFLGSFGVDFLEQRNRLQDLKLRANSERRRSAERQHLSSEGLERGRALWRRARALDLVEGESPPDSAQELQDDLNAALEFRGESPLPNLASNLERLEEEEAEQLRLAEQVRREFSTTNRYLKLTKDSADAAGLLHHKISVRQLFPGLENETCPICNHQLPIENWESHLDAAEQALGQEVSTDPRIRSGLQRIQGQLKKRLSKIESELSTLRSRIQQARSDLASKATDTKRREARQRLAGRIEEYLRNMENFFLGYKSDLGGLLQEISKLEEKVGDSVLARKRKSAEGGIRDLATALSSDLGTEFPDATVRLLLSDIAIEVQLDGKWTSLSEIGSGANWVGFHLGCALALHAQFKHEQGPVPRVLLLDQPSQAWFPPEGAKVSGEKEPERNADRLAVERLYEVLRDFCSDRDYQIIAVDHARPSADWFRKHVVRDWHTAGGLVPDSWITEQPDRERKGQDRGRDD